MTTTWFKLFPREFLTDSKVKLLSREHRSILLELWCFCAMDGSIPSDPATLARLIGESAATTKRAMEKLSGFFVEEGGALFSVRLRAEVSAYEEKCQRLRDNASKGGKEKAANALANASGPNLANAKATDLANALAEPAEAEAEAVKERELPPTPFGVGAPEAGGGRGRAPRQKRRTRAEVLQPFPPELRAWVNRVAGRWPTEDAKDGRAVRMDPEVLAENAQAILADQPGLTLDLLEEAARNYLASAPQRWKAPQFFFGPGKAPDGPPWRPWARALLPDEAHLPVSA